MNLNRDSWPRLVPAVTSQNPPVATETSLGQAARLDIRTVKVLPKTVSKVESNCYNCRMLRACCQPASFACRSRRSACAALGRRAGSGSMQSVISSSTA